MAASAGSANKGGGKAKKVTPVTGMSIVVQSARDKRRLENLFRDAEEYTDAEEARARAAELRRSGRMASWTALNLTGLGLDRDGEVVYLVKDRGARPDKGRKAANPVPEPIQGMCWTNDKGVLCEWGSDNPYQGR